MAYPDQKEIDKTVVYLAILEHSLRANCSPNQRSIVHNLRSITGEALLVIFGTEIGDIRKHPSQY